MEVNNRDRKKRRKKIGGACGGSEGEVALVTMHVGMLHVVEGNTRRKPLYNVAVSWEGAALMPPINEMQKYFCSTI